MANASSFLIGANDEHGLNPPTQGKRTPTMPYIERSFYENEFNSQAKLQFILSCLRCGFNVYDIHPEEQDVSISTRVVRANRAGLTLLVTFAYNAYGDGTTFNSANGLEVFYSAYNPYPTASRLLSEDIYNQVLSLTERNGRGVSTLSVGVLSSVNFPSALIEAGFMTNFGEAKLMLNPIFVANVGDGACRGVCEYLDVDYVEEDLSNYPLTSRGSSNNFVTIIQYLLNEYGFDLSVDGIFGTNTYNAVQTFQGYNSLTQDGIVGPNTWTALLNLDPTAYTLSYGSRKSAVLFLQKLLLSYLYPITSLDSIFGSETLAAVKAFQTENNLTVDGIVGPNTWVALLSSLGRSNT